MHFTFRKVDNELMGDPNPTKTPTPHTEPWRLQDYGKFVRYIIVFAVLNPQPHRDSNSVSIAVRNPQPIVTVTLWALSSVTRSP